MPSGSGYFASDYIADNSILDTRFKRFWFAMMWVAIILFPFIASNYAIHLINLVALAIIATLSMNLLTGYTGIISLGHAAFLCSGAFTTIALGTQFGLPFWIVVPIASVIGAILGLIAGLPAMKLRGLYLAMSTLAIHFIVIYLANWYQRLVAGGAGISGFYIPSPNLGTWLLDSAREWYLFLVVIVTIVTIFCINLVRSRVGRAWITIRDRDLAAKVLGVNLAYYKLLAFAFTSGLAAFAGSLSVYYTNQASIEEFSLWLAIVYIAAIIVGGMGSILGSFLGAFFVILTPYVLAEFASLFGAGSALQVYFFATQYAFFGVIIVLFLVLEPKGLVGMWSRIRDFMALWPFKYMRVISTTK